MRVLVERILGGDRGESQPAADRRQSAVGSWQRGNEAVALNISQRDSSQFILYTHSYTQVIKCNLH